MGSMRYELSNDRKSTCNNRTDSIFSGEAKKERNTIKKELMERRETAMEVKAVFQADRITDLAEKKISGRERAESFGRMVSGKRDSAGM